MKKEKENLMVMAVFAPSSRNGDIVKDYRLNWTVGVKIIIILIVAKYYFQSIIKLMWKSYFKLYQYATQVFKYGLCITFVLFWRSWFDYQSTYSENGMLLQGEYTILTRKRIITTTVYTVSKTCQRIMMKVCILQQPT